MLHASLGLGGRDDGRDRHPRDGGDDDGVAYMNETDPMLSFDEIDGTDESLKAHDIVIAGMEQAPRRSG